MNSFLVLVIVATFGGFTSGQPLNITDHLNDVTCPATLTFVSQGEIKAQYPDMVSNYAKTRQIFNGVPIYKQVNGNYFG